MYFVHVSLLPTHQCDFTVRFDLFGVVSSLHLLLKPTVLSCLKSLCNTKFFCHKYNRVILWSLWWFWLRIGTRKRQNDIFCNENKFYVQKGGWCVSEAPFYDITISYCNFDTCSHLVCLWSWSTTTRLYDIVYIADIILSMRDGVIIKRIILWATLHGNGL